MMIPLVFYELMNDRHRIMKNYQSYNTLLKVFLNTPLNKIVIPRVLHK